MIRVVVASDHPAVRAGLRGLFASDATIAVVGEASTGRVALDLVERLAPDVVLLATALPELSGLEVARRLRRGRTRICPAIVFIGGADVPQDVVALADRRLATDSSPREVVRTICDAAGQR